MYTYQAMSSEICEVFINAGVEGSAIEIVGRSKPKLLPTINCCIFSYLNSLAFNPLRQLSLYLSFNPSFSPIYMIYVNHQCLLDTLQSPNSVDNQFPHFFPFVSDLRVATTLKYSM
jgi:hypothetical protein